MLLVLKKKFIGLVVVSSSKYAATNIDLLKGFCNRMRMGGVFITANRPYNTLANDLKSRHIDIENLFFIDTVTKGVAAVPDRAEKCLYINSPRNLTEISIALEQIIVEIPTKEKFLYLDSVSTLLSYNDQDTVIKFVHFLVTKMREIWKMYGILIVLEKETDERIISQLAQFCDKVVEVK